TSLPMSSRRRRSSRPCCRANRDKSCGPSFPFLSSLHARFERGFHGFQLLVDRMRGLEFGNLVFEALRPHAKRLGPAFGEIGPALEQFKPAERIFGAAAVHDLASL